MQSSPAGMERVRSNRIVLLGLLVLAGALCGCGEVTAVTGSRAPRACRTSPGPSPAQCRLMGSDEDWLPPAYVRNAACRCQATPNSPSANCVRGRLEAELLAVPEATRSEWRRQKAALYREGRPGEYERWVQETAGREIYRWHERAHSRCCCPTALPPYEQWSALLVVPFDSCSEVRALSHFGSCRGATGRW